MSDLQFVPPKGSHFYEFGPPGVGKSDAIARMFRRRWWEFWKPRMPVIKPRFIMMAVLDPSDMQGYLTPADVQSLVGRTPFDKQEGA